MTVYPFRGVKIQRSFAIISLLVGALIMLSNKQSINLIFIAPPSLPLGMVISFIGIFYLLNQD